jgi:hypothetical protein
MTMSAAKKCQRQIREYSRCADCGDSGEASALGRLGDNVE